MAETERRENRAVRRLSAAQIKFIRACGDGVLASRDADYRSHGALLSAGIIAMTYAGARDGGGGYCLTPIGRAALAEIGSGE